MHLRRKKTSTSVITLTVDQPQISCGAGAENIRNLLGKGKFPTQKIIMMNDWSKEISRMLAFPGRFFLPIRSITVFVILDLKPDKEISLERNIFKERERERERERKKERERERERERLII